MLTYTATPDIYTLSLHDALPIYRFSIQDRMPTLTIFFDIDPKKGLERIDSNREREQNRLDLEKIHFHELVRSEEHTSELQSRGHLVCRLLLEEKNKKKRENNIIY